MRGDMRNKFTKSIKQKKTISKWQDELRKSFQGESQGTEITTSVEKKNKSTNVVEEISISPENSPVKHIQNGVIEDPIIISPEVTPTKKFTSLEQEDPILTSPEAEAKIKSRPKPDFDSIIMSPETSPSKKLDYLEDDFKVIEIERSEAVSQESPQKIFIAPATPVKRKNEAFYNDEYQEVQVNEHDAKVSPEKIFNTPKKVKGNDYVRVDESPTKKVKISHVINPQLISDVAVDIDSLIHNSFSKLNIDRNYYLGDLGNGKSFHSKNERKGNSKIFLKSQQDFKLFIKSLVYLLDGQESFKPKDSKYLDYIGLEFVEVLKVFNSQSSSISKDDLFKIKEKVFNGIKKELIEISKIYTNLDNFDKNHEQEVKDFGWKMEKFSFVKEQEADLKKKKIEENGIRLKELFANMGKHPKQKAPENATTTSLSSSSASDLRSNVQNSNQHKPRKIEFVDLTKDESKGRGK